jgi:hypothetical protein
MKKKYWWIAGIVLIAVFIIFILNFLSCTDGCGSVGITLKCQTNNDCKYIENPPVPGEPGCYKLKAQGNYYVNNSKQCECVNSICQVKTISNTTTQTAASVRKEEIFRYDLVKSFEYKLTSSNGINQTFMYNLETNITSDSVNGAEAWLEQIEMTDAQYPTISATIIIKLWMDKVTHKCLKEITLTPLYGRYIENVGQCGGDINPPISEGTIYSSWSGMQPPLLNYTGKEIITVPAGTFNADKYIENDKPMLAYWIASNVPVPIKIDNTLELVSYSLK